MRVYAIIIILLLLTTKVKSQAMLWTAFENLNDSLRKERRPLLIFVYTEWCKFCKMQEQTTFSDTTVINSLRSKFYCLKLNAENKSEIIFLNRTYSPKSAGYHELTEYFCLIKGQITFPSSLFFTKELILNENVSGFMDTEYFKKIIE